DTRHPELPPCPECSESDTYEQGGLLACPTCGHEWAVADVDEGASSAGGVVRDAVGNELADGDTVTIIKGLKVSGGGGGSIKAGTKVNDLIQRPSGSSPAGQKRQDCVRAWPALDRSLDPCWPRRRRRG
ncbi:alkylphosphonate utilization protein, partial [Kribbia dieselivorans]|uniref:alkylphosphonate utilization protein n=1 Tax=Kribbia dieselivorans TaxID=331526 RepID=UPI0012ECCBCE